MSELDPLFIQHAQFVGRELLQQMRSGEPFVLPEYLAPNEAARFLSVPERTLGNWRRQADGPPFTRYGQTIRYKVSDLQDWMEAHREGA